MIRLIQFNWFSINTTDRQRVTIYYNYNYIILIIIIIIIHPPISMHKLVLNFSEIQIHFNYIVLFESFCYYWRLINYSLRYDEFKI